MWPTPFHYLDPCPTDKRVDDDDEEYYLVKKDASSFMSVGGVTNKCIVYVNGSTDHVSSKTVKRVRSLPNCIPLEHLRRVCEASVEIWSTLQTSANLGFSRLIWVQQWGSWLLVNTQFMWNRLRGLLTVERWAGCGELLFKISSWYYFGVVLVNNYLLKGESTHQIE